MEQLMRDFAEKKWGAALDNIIENVNNLRFIRSAVLLAIRENVKHVEIQNLLIKSSLDLFAGTDDSESPGLLAASLERWSWLKKMLNKYEDSHNIIPSYIRTKILALTQKKAPHLYKQAARLAPSDVSTSSSTNGHSCDRDHSSFDNDDHDTRYTKCNCWRNRTERPLAHKPLAHKKNTLKLSSKDYLPIDSLPKKLYITTRSFLESCLLGNRIGKFEDKVDFLHSLKNYEFSNADLMAIIDKLPIELLEYRNPHNKDRNFLMATLEDPEFNFPVIMLLIIRMSQESVSTHYNCCNKDNATVNTALSYAIYHKLHPAVILALLVKMGYMSYESLSDDVSAGFFARTFYIPDINPILERLQDDQMLGAMGFNFCSDENFRTAFNRHDCEVKQLNGREDELWEVMNKLGEANRTFKQPHRISTEDYSFTPVLDASNVDIDIFFAKWFKKYEEWVFEKIKLCQAIRIASHLRNGLMLLQHTYTLVKVPTVIITNRSDSPLMFKFANELFWEAEMLDSTEFGNQLVKQEICLSFGAYISSIQMPDPMPYEIEGGKLITKILKRLVAVVSCVKTDKPLLVESMGQFKMLLEYRLTNTLASAYALIQKYEKAMKNIDYVLENDEKNATAWFIKAQIYFRMGGKGLNHMEYLKKAYDIDPELPQAKDLLVNSTNDFMRHSEVEWSKGNLSAACSSIMNGYHGHKETCLDFLVNIGVDVWYKRLIDLVNNPNKYGQAIHPLPSVQSFIVPLALIICDAMPKANILWFNCMARAVIELPPDIFTEISIDQFEEINGYCNSIHELKARNSQEAFIQAQIIVEEIEFIMDHQNLKEVSENKPTTTDGGKDNVIPKNQIKVIKDRLKKFNGMKWKKSKTVSKLMARFLKVGQRLLSAKYFKIGLTIHQIILKKYPYLTEDEKYESVFELNAYVLYCHSVMKAKDYETCLKIANVSIQLFKSDEEQLLFQLIKAKTYRQLRDFPNAFELCDTCLKLDSSSSDAYFERGMCFMLSKENDNAKEAFEKCLEIAPNHKNALVALKKMKKC